MLRNVLLIPPESPELFQLVSGWLGDRENYQWLDFDDGRQLPSREWLKVAMHRRTAVLRVFTSDREYQPIGVVGLNRVNAHFGTANVWVVLGEKAFARQGYATRAVSRLLTHGFGLLGLRSIHAWVVEHNVSLEIVRRLGFTPIGRQRQCHAIDGRPCDRLWFDLLAAEHKEISDEHHDGAPDANRAAVL
jgi:RimJ/RimL family protein N-acetyltransferase